METLQKIDPQKHMYRWYSVGIQKTLVDGIAVIVGWGSLKCSFQHWRTYTVKSQKEAEQLKAKIIAYRIKKGYRRSGVI